MNITQQRSARETGFCGAIVVCVAAMLCGSGACAQAVYRCEADGKVSYSHAPCIGATVVDTTPTEGLDASSGARRVGRDVQRERLKLPASVKLECQWLDHRLPVQESSAKNANAQGREKAEAELFLSRSRFRNLGC